MRRFVEVNEALVNATGAGANWWATWRGHMEPTGRVTVLVASLGGDRVKVAVDDAEGSEAEFIAMLVEQGLPKTAAKAVKLPGIGYEHGCMAQGSMTCPRHQAGKPTTKKCPRCGGQWIVRRGTYGVFTWTGAGRYPIAAAHATFSTEARADALTKKDPGRNWVVRFIDEASL